MSYPDDEEAIAIMFDDALANCGNNGQQTIVQQVKDSEFVLYCINVLEEEGLGADWDTFVEQVKAALSSNDDGLGSGAEEKFDATDLIWEEFYKALAEQTGYHDSTDEVGEGTGEESQIDPAGDPGMG